MRYFLPYWPADKIYEKFDPWSEAHSGETKHVWEIFSRPSIDGVLVSVVNIKQTNRLKNKAEKEGIHRALRFDGPIMGDCGAWSYIREEKPPFEPIDTLRFYKKLGFDIGVTVDHLIFKATMGQKEERWNLTIENAKKMFDEASKTAYEHFCLVGAVQGWDQTSYVSGVRELVEHGFNYIGLGGLARKSTNQIQTLLLSVGKYLRHFSKREKGRVDLHLFGIAREDLLPLMREVGVVSFDSASPLRRAWLSANKNYMLKDDFYTAVRLPIIKDKRAEAGVIKAVQSFEKNEVSLDEFLKAICKYDTERFKLRENDYKRTLIERPWDKCGCPICKSLGIHVCVFRMSERNMRRGFHNIYQFHKNLRSEYPRYLVFTMCSAKKDPNPNPLPAFKRYLPSPMFRTFWKNVYDLPLELGVLSAKYFLIDWNTQIMNYDVKLNTHQVNQIKKDLSKKLPYFDRIFFIGLGLYRQVVMQIARELALPAEVFPKDELTSRGKLDLIEYMRQMKFFREAIVQSLPSSNIKYIDFQPTLTDFARE